MTEEENNFVLFKGSSQEISRRNFSIEKTPTPWKECFVISTLVFI